jgi:hypothetical protein
MSETQTVVKNPYDTDNMPEGGGLTRDGIVTSAKYVTYPMTRRDGSAVIDERTKQPSYFVGLRLTAIRTGDAKNEGKEDKYEFSAGKKAKPSADGELLLDETGAPAPIHKKSNVGRALLALEAGGFDKRTLYPKVSVLVGAKITFGGVDKKGADGKTKTHVYEGKTFNDIEWFPQTYLGGAGSRVASASGSPAADELGAKAEAAVVAAIAEAGGEIERKDLIRALGAGLKGDADSVRITALVARADFHAGRPWTFDPATSKLKLGA